MRKPLREVRGVVRPQQVEQVCVVCGRGLGFFQEKDGIALSRKPEAGLVRIAVGSGGSGYSAQGWAELECWLRLETGLLGRWHHKVTRR